MPPFIKLDARIFAGLSAEARGFCHYCNPQTSSITPEDEELARARRTRSYEIEARQLRERELRKL